MLCWLYSTRPRSPSITCRACKKPYCILLYSIHFPAECLRNNWASNFILTQKANRIEAVSPWYRVDHSSCSQADQKCKVSRGESGLKTGELSASQDSQTLALAILPQVSRWIESCTGNMTWYLDVTGSTPTNPEDLQKQTMSPSTWTPSKHDW